MGVRGGRTAIHRACAHRIDQSADNSVVSRAAASAGPETRTRKPQMAPAELRLKEIPAMSPRAPDTHIRRKPTAHCPAARQITLPTKLPSSSYFKNTNCAPLSISASVILLRNYYVVHNKNFSRCNRINFYF